MNFARNLASQCNIFTVSVRSICKMMCFGLQSYRPQAHLAINCPKSIEKQNCNSTRDVFTVHADHILSIQVMFSGNRRELLELVTLSYGGSSQNERCSDLGKD